MNLLENSSKLLQKRSRPLLGTFFSISFYEKNSEIISAAFNEAARLEKIFSLTDNDSEVSKFNAQFAWPLQNLAETSLSGELSELLKIAQLIFEESKGSFFPFKNLQKTQIDLNGIAKGFIVDRVVDFLMAHDRDFSGIVNAGGDLRFINYDDKTVQIRSGSLEKPFLRTLLLPKSALATSSLAQANSAAESTTVYRLPLRAGLQINFAIAVNADRCCIADALTKVALHAPEEQTVLHCARFFQAEILIVDDRGEVIRLFKET